MRNTAAASGTKRPGWELVAVGVILGAYLLANVAIVLARPRLMRSAVTSSPTQVTPGSFCGAQLAVQLGSLV